MRRKDREMDRAFALSVLDKCEYAVLATVTPNGAPYCIPVTIVRDRDALYLHCAHQGQKVDCLRHNPRVCLTAVGATNLIPEKFTTEYESAVVTGQAEELTSPEEKLHALHLLCLRHAGPAMDKFEDAASASLSRTGIWRVRMEEITGKRKKYDSQGNEMTYGRME